MKLKMIALSLVAVFALSAFAQQEQRQQRRRGKKRPQGVARLLKAKSRVCKKVKLTKAQRKATRKLLKKSRNSRTDLRASLKSARQAYRALLKDESANFASAQDAAAALAEARAKLHKAKLDLKTEVLFDVLEADQRLKANRCIKQGKKQRRRRARRRGRRA